MIARMWRGLASTATADDYVRHLETAVFRELEGMRGYGGSDLLRRAVDGGVEFVVITWWESLDAIRQFAGDDLDTAVVPPAAQALLPLGYDRTVRHFEVARGREDR